jgi:hypothetical protein
VLVQAGPPLLSLQGQAVTFDRARGNQWRARTLGVERGR